jgi:hypothetical protein
MELEIEFAEEFGAGFVDYWRAEGEWQGAFLLRSFFSKLMVCGPGEPESAEYSSAPIGSTGISIGA